MWRIKEERGCSNDGSGRTYNEERKGVAGRKRGSLQEDVSIEEVVFRGSAVRYGTPYRQRDTQNRFKCTAKLI